MIGSIVAVFCFEWKRALTVPRMLWWAVLALFPVFIVGLVRYTASTTSGAPEELWRDLCVWLIFALIPMLVSMLGTLLWATPAISTELERRSWVYLAVRPNGATAILLGKYFAAVTWVIPPAVFGLTIAVPLAHTGDDWRIWWTMVRLVLLSCPAYAAIYLFLGVLMPRRSMVLAVAYTLFFELVISFVPAVINKITVQYRLRALAANWCNIEIPGGRESGAMMLIGNEAATTHVTTLFVMIVTLLVVSILTLRFSEFSSSAETDN